MALSQAIVFYLLFGGGVAVAVALANETKGRGEALFRMATAFAFWPLYVPLLLQPARRLGLPAPPSELPLPDDSLAATIKQTEAELDSALGSLDGWAGGVLAKQHDRFAELRAAWRAQAERLRQLDLLLSHPDFSPDMPLAIGEADNGRPPETERLRQSELARAENLRKLRTLRITLHEDLLGTLAWVRELVTMIHLAKYTGAPASQAEELVGQIAAAVEGLSEVSHWQKERAAG